MVTYKGPYAPGGDILMVAQDSKQIKGLHSTDCDKCCALREINTVWLNNGVGLG